MTGDRIPQARRAIRGETRWTPELAYPPVMLTALTEEIRDLRAALDAIIPLVPGIVPALEWLHWERTPCSGCGRPMIWSITDTGSKMPLQAVPNPDGDRVAWRDSDGIIRDRAYRDGEPLNPPELGDAEYPRAFRFVAHWADCPKAPFFKKPR
jgi:hypothetical protein